MTQAAVLQKPAFQTGASDKEKAQAFEAVLEEIRQRKVEFDQKAHVPKDMIARLKSIGIYRAGTPQCFGGAGTPPADFLRMIERIAEADGSTGWVASFGSANVYLGALPKATQAKLYANGPDVAFGAALFPVQQAQRAEGGWTVNGTWKFGSGCMGADWFGVGIGFETEGPYKGKPRSALFSPDKIEIVENWNVLGLTGTGSHDIRVNNQFIADEWTFIRGGAPTIDEPLYRYPTIAYAAQVLAVVNLGVARAALNVVKDLGMGTGVTGAPKLADRPYFRTEVAKAEAALRSCRAFFYETTEEVWASIMAGNPVTPDQVSLLRLASAHISHEGAKVVQSAYMLAGTGAIYDDHPLQWQLRDAMVVVQHAFNGPGIYDGAGAVMLGVPPMPGYL